MPVNRWRRRDNGDRKHHRQTLPEVDATCYGYEYVSMSLFLYYVATVLLLGIPTLIGRWFSKFKLKALCRRVPLAKATVVLIKDDSESYFICDVSMDHIDASLEDLSVDCGSIESQYSASSPLCSASHNIRHFRYFIFHHEKFIWDNVKQKFVRINGLRESTCAELLDNFNGISHVKRLELRKLYGSNSISVEVQGYIKLLFDEVLNPFYCFQVMSVILWSFDEYYYYATCVVLISAISIIISLRETRRQREMLRDMATANMDFLVTVKRWDGEEEDISCMDLVPGDVLYIPPEGIIMPVDAVLQNGSCLVNESMLTGESVPVTKCAVQRNEEMYNDESHKRHTLFNGTHIIQTRFYAGHKVTCVVIKTGYGTLKGQLIRSMLFPKEIGFQFYVDAMKFVALLFCIAAIGMAYCIVLYIQRQTHWTAAVVRVLDIITIVVPPALPAAMTVGTFYAQTRLKHRKIFCISPPRINFCGKISLAAFDKTGTLTEDGLDFWCVVPFENTAADFEDPVTDMGGLPEDELSHFLRCCATCHSLTYVNGCIVGDPMDIKMFAATGWELEEPLPNIDDTRKYDMLMPNVVKKNEVEIGILRELEFTPQLQRMSVVVKPLDAPMALYCKGAPERLRPLFVNQLPTGFDKVLDSFTLKGYRVLALAYRIVSYKWHEIQRLERDELERDLHFCGFLVMQNSLKPATIPVIRELNAASIRSVMVTGDNMLTALSVARECGMISSAEKVIIVNVINEDGPIPALNFTLAAHHYEVNGNDNEPSDSQKLSPIVPIPAFTVDVMQTDSIGDITIDMERLIPINEGKFDSKFGNKSIGDYHFVMNGKTWITLLEKCPPNIVEKIIAKATVFARMSPESKSQMVEAFQNMGYIVAMCGDGANDCSALKMAHVGISLSDAEASVAAPFTSKIQDVSGVPHIIREGRCALATSFSVFKFMALYSMVQFISVIILYTSKTNFADTQFLYIDLGITTSIAVVMGRTEPYPHLVKKRPMGSLISFSNVMSILLQIMLSAAFQICAIFFLKQQSWFTPLNPPDADTIVFTCWETTTIFSVSAFQYLILALVFSKGPPFRKPFYSNGAFVFGATILVAFTALLVVHPPDVLSNFFYLMPFADESSRFRILLAVFPVANLVLSLFLENVLVTSSWTKTLGTYLCWKKPPHRFKQVLENLRNDPTWPPLRSSR